jgi:hypothetical protein
MSNPLSVLHLRFGRVSPTLIWFLARQCLRTVAVADGLLLRENDKPLFDNKQSI